MALALCFQLDQVLEHRRVAQRESAAFTRPRPQVRALPCLALDPKSRFSPGSRHSRGAGQGTNRDFQFPPVDLSCRSSSLRLRRPWRNATNHTGAYPDGMLRSASRNVPHGPRQRVEVLAWAHTHLLVGQAGEGALHRRHPVAAHGGRVHRGMLIQEQLTSIHVAFPGRPANQPEHRLE